MRERVGHLHQNLDPPLMQSRLGLCRRNAPDRLRPRPTLLELPPSRHIRNSQKLRHFCALIHAILVTGVSLVLVEEIRISCEDRTGLQRKHRDASNRTSCSAGLHGSSSLIIDVRIVELLLLGCLEGRNVVPVQ